MSRSDQRGLKRRAVQLEVGTLTATAMRLTPVTGFNLSCKLTDFGVLRHPESETGVLLGGSLPWQAPECSRGHFFEVEDAKRTDIYSFGMLLWRLFLDGDPFSHLEDSGLVSYLEADTPKQRRTKRNDAVARLKEDDGLVKHVCDSLALAGKFTRTQLEMLCEVVCITLVKDASRRELSLARIIALLTEDQWFEPRHPVPPSRMPRQFNAKLLDVEKWHSEFDKASPVVLEYLASGFKDYAEGRTKRVGNNTDEGQSAAAYQLAICYANGFGVPFNADECIKWLIFAAQRGSRKAEDALPKICRATGAEKEMTVYQQRSDARVQLSSSWDSNLTADFTTRMAYVSEDSSISASASGLSSSAEVSWTFLSAAENCRYDALRELLSQSTKPGISEDGVSPLHFLSMWDVSEAKKLGQQLIQAGADVNCVAKRGNTVGGTPLMWSVYGNRLDHSDILIKLGADPMVRTSDGDDALSFAARLHLTSQLRHLLENLRPVQVRDHIGRLIEAAAGGESRFTRMARHQEHWRTAATETLSFLKQWHDLFNGSANFNNLLLSAIHASLKSDYGRMNADVQLEFIDRYRINASELKGLLRESVLSHNIDLFNGLLDYGVRVQGKYDQGKTLLHLCARIPDHNLAATVFAPRLLDLGAEVDVCDEDGLTPWMDAILERKWDLADLLMRKDAKPLRTNKDGFNVLGLCIKAVNIGSLKYLLKYCAKKEAFHQDSFIVNPRTGISALQLVAQLSMPRSHGWKCEVVGMFLLVLANYAREPWQLTYRSSGILPDASALDIAISTGNVHAVKNLVKKGAHRDPTDKARALHIATQKLRDSESSAEEEDWLYRQNLQRSVFIIENWDGEDQKRVRKMADDWTNVRTIDESHPASSWELVIWKYKDRAGVTVSS